MKSETIFELILETFNEIFPSFEQDLDLHTSAKDVPSWDSLANIRLILAIESKFNVRFTTGEVAHFENIGSIIHLLKKKTSSL